MELCFTKVENVEVAREELNIAFPLEEGPKVPLENAEAFRVVECLIHGLKRRKGGSVEWM